jgi:hypothetical protein
MEIKFKKNIDLERTTLFAAVGRRGDNRYCLFIHEFSKTSCIGFWASNNSSRIMRDDNANLSFKELDLLLDEIAQKILEKTGHLQELYKEINAILQTEFTTNKQQENIK